MAGVEQGKQTDRTPQGGRARTPDEPVVQCALHGGLLIPRIAAGPDDAMTVRRGSSLQGIIEACLVLALLNGREHGQTKSGHGVLSVESIDHTFNGNKVSLTIRLHFKGDPRGSADDCQVQQVQMFASEQEHTQGKVWTNRRTVSLIAKCTGDQDTPRWQIHCGQSNNQSLVSALVTFQDLLSHFPQETWVKCFSSAGERAGSPLKECYEGGHLAHGLFAKIKEWRPRPHSRKTQKA